MLAKPILARDIMVTKLITLRPDMDAFDAIELLLKHKISGAPVVDASRRLIGVFSERCSMSVVLEGAYQQLPTNDVAAFMDTSPRTIDEEVDLLSIAQIFQETSFRRLPVLRDGILVGQISRRDLLRAVHQTFAQATCQDSALLYLSSLMERSEHPIG
ncbi:CBS domain-containing protein [Thalassoroseus pseudoceratinae]|uniref:CBS domain-containing protein n=1 Tax=Thalassoroseus pseudoceratinae TaxID=2713176 RepID=UPI0014212D97|nr:CBS domain-containing protein [Thalassoroseus pseudoceratinae]